MFLIATAARHTKRPWAKDWYLSPTAW